MRSNIPFGAKSEAAQALITNGNGNGHYNGKSGSVSSASSSVSSSTENLKMNGFSKTGTNFLEFVDNFIFCLKKKCTYIHICYKIDWFSNALILI